MIRDENGLLSGYVYVDFETAKIDVGSYVEQAKQAVTAGVALPAGYAVSWSGQYENMMRVRERLKLVVPLTLVLIFVLLYLNTRSSFKAAVVMLAVPFSVVGAVWLLYALARFQHRRWRDDCVAVSYGSGRWVWHHGHGSPGW